MPSESTDGRAHLKTLWRIRDTTAFVCSGAERVVALDLTDIGKAPLALEGSGAVIWSALLGPVDVSQRIARPVSEVVARVADQFGMEQVEVEATVTDFLSQLAQAGLLETIHSSDVADHQLSSETKPWNALLEAGTGGDASTLRRLEAIELAYAMAHRAGENIGVRVLAIKGLVGVWHKLREPRVPSDIDVLVHPDDFEPFRKELERVGWRSRMGEFTDFWGEHHSVTMLHDEWPCDIDVHRWYPGFLEEPATAFEEVWSRSIPIPFGGRCVPAGGQASSILVMALHSLRSNPDDSRHGEELLRLRSLANQIGKSDRDVIRRLAAITGADVALGGALQDLGVPTVAENAETDRAALYEWKMQMRGHSTGMRRWLRYAFRGSPTHWARQLAFAFWPPANLMRTWYCLPPGNRAVRRARLSRWWRALMALPAVLTGNPNLARRRGTLQRIEGLD